MFQIPMVYGFVFLMLALEMGNHVSLASGQPAADSPVRKTDSGPIQGYLHTLKSSGKQVERYLGVPYAAPPVGNLRFQIPVPPSRWNDVLQTTRISPACIQDQLENAYITTHNPEYDGQMSEDCLYINIYVPHNTSRERAPIPVLIHVHGGSNVVGMGAMFHGDVLASTGDIIVINFNYRLGPFGFLYMPQLGMTGNYGLFDQNLVFAWVKTNIAAFGGDPDRVTIQGHSAGSVDVGLHILSPMAKGLFRSAIMMSGSPTAYWAVTFDSDEEDDEERRRKNLELLDCGGRTREETITCLYQVPYETLSNAYYHYKHQLHNFAPAVDGMYVVDHPMKMLARMAKDDDLKPSCNTIMIGVTHDEGSLTAEVAAKVAMNIPVRRGIKGDLTPPEDVDYWGSLTNEMYPEFRGFMDIAQYLYTPWPNESNATARIIEFSNFFGDNTFTAPAIELADGFIGLKGSNVYLYRFNHISEQTTFPAWIGVPHGEDQFYIFGSPVDDHELHNYTHADVEVSHKMMQLWAGFVYDHKNISIQNEPLQLPRYSTGEEFLEISSKSQSGAFFGVNRHLRKKYAQFWNNVLPLVLYKQVAEKHSEDRYDVIVWVTTALLCVFAVLSLILLGCLIFHLRNKKGASVNKQELIEDSGHSNAT